MVSLQFWAWSSFDIQLNRMLIYFYCDDCTSVLSLLPIAHWKLTTCSTFPFGQRSASIAIADLLFVYLFGIDFVCLRPIKWPVCVCCLRFSDVVRAKKMCSGFMLYDSIVDWMLLDNHDIDLNVGSICRSQSFNTIAHTDKPEKSINQFHFHRSLSLLSL